MATLPSVDVVGEFKIDSNSQKAEFEGATAVTITTKSGANQIHGSAYEFNRNKAYAARNFFSPVLPPFNRNEYGFALGGPIRHDKTFIFGGYEALRERASATYTLSASRRRRCAPAISVGCPQFSIRSPAFRSRIIRSRPPALIRGRRSSSTLSRFRICPAAAPPAQSITW